MIEDLTRGRHLEGDSLYLEAPMYLFLWVVYNKKSSHNEKVAIQSCLTRNAVLTKKELHRSLRVEASARTTLHLAPSAISRQLSATHSQGEVDRCQEVPLATLYRWVCFETQV